jgi:hypothetical protein
MDINPNPTTMTPDQQRTAIATACGWKCAGHPQQLEATEGYNFGYQFVINPDGQLVTHNSIPDYLNDLNAMHEAEKVLSGEQKEQFIFWLNHLHPLADIHYSDKQNDMRLEVFSLIHSTAAEKAEAFLRTLNLWTETPTPVQNAKKRDSVYRRTYAEVMEENL